MARQRLDPATAVRLARLCDPAVEPGRDGDVTWKTVAAGYTWLGSGRAGLQILLLAAVPDEIRWSRPVYALIVRAPRAIAPAEWVAGEAAALVPLDETELSGGVHQDVRRMAGVAVGTLGNHLQNAREGKMELYVAGADLGGAVAAVAGMLLAAGGVPAQRLAVYTFGAPEFGDQSLASRVHDRLPLFSIAREGDPLPALPGKAAGYQPAGEALRLVEHLEGAGTGQASLKTSLEPATGADLAASPDPAALDARLQIYHPIASYVKALSALDR